MNEDGNVAQANTDATAETTPVVENNIFTGQPDTQTTPPDTEPAVTEPETPPEGNEPPGEEPPAEDGETDPDAYVPIEIEALNIPTELMDEMKAFGYDVPAGMQMLNEFAQAEGIDPVTSEKFAKFYVENFAKAQIEMVSKQFDDQIKTLKDHYQTDQKFDEAQIYVSKAVKNLAGEEATALTDRLRTSGMGVDPILYKVLEKAGRLISDDKGNRSAEQPGGKKPRSVADDFGFGVDNINKK